MPADEAREISADTQHIPLAPLEAEAACSTGINALVRVLSHET